MRSGPQDSAERVSLPAVRAALGLLTAVHTGVPVNAADFTDGHDPADVATAAVVMAAAVLRISAPGAHGSQILRIIGLEAASGRLFEARRARLSGGAQ